MVIPWDPKDISLRFLRFYAFLQATRNSLARLIANPAGKMEKFVSPASMDGNKIPASQV